MLKLNVALVVSLIVAVPGWAITVDYDTAGAGDYDTIGDALNNAVDGDTISVKGKCTEWGMHLTPDHPISCGLPLRQPACEGNHLAEVVGPTTEAHCASWRDGAAQFETRRRCALQPSQRGRIGLQSRDAISWGFGSQVHTPIWGIGGLKGLYLHHVSRDRERLDVIADVPCRIDFLM